MFCADDGTRVTSVSGPEPSRNVSLNQQELVDQAVREASGDLFASLSACRVVRVPAVAAGERVLQSPLASGMASESVQLQLPVLPAADLSASPATASIEKAAGILFASLSPSEPHVSRG